MAIKKTTTPKKKATDKPADEKEKKAAAVPSAPKVKKVKEPAAAKPKKKPVSEEITSKVEMASDTLRPFITPPPTVVPPKPVAAPAPVAPKVVAPAAPPATTAPKITPPPAASPVPAPVAKPTPPAPKAPPAQATPKPATPPAKPAFQKPKIDHAPKAPVARTFTPPAQKPTPPKAPPVRQPVSSEASVETPAPTTRKKLQINDMMTVKDLADAMNVKVIDVIKKLLSLGTPATINQRIDSETATLIADSFNFDVDHKSIYDDMAQDAPENEANLKPRSPVVTVMGHVDHGKTSLLDAIRSASVAKGEAGGITQHIGAYQVVSPKGTITFLDTPGHEAFTAMRARGAMVTDIVILVVAADDSVMPQTIEAIHHAKAAEVPIVVAINKMDLPTANVQKVKQELAQYELLSEDWGGKTVMVEVSARNGTNIEKLIEMLLLEAELLELKANPDRPAKGIVLEAHMDARRGNTATILIQAGTLKIGDVVVCGLSHGRVRAMLDDNWKAIETAGPSVPVRLLGLAQIPQVGDQLSVVSQEREARELAERRRQFIKDSAAQKSSHVTLENLHSQIAEGKVQDLPIILKTDVQGSMQAIQDSLGKLSGSPIKLHYVHTGSGNINESDVLLAEASNAIVFGFHVKVETSAEVEAKKAGVDIRTYQIIYEMLADVKAAMEGLLKPEEKEVVKGRLQVKTVFPSSRYGAVAGGLVIEGKLVRGNKARLVRGSKIIATGTIDSLRRFKDDVKDVEKGYECGLSIEGIRSYEVGDVIEAIVIEKHARRLDA